MPLASTSNSTHDSSFRIVFTRGLWFNRHIIPEPDANNITTAMALETRRASRRRVMKRNGITTGNVDRNTKKNTPSAPRQSEAAFGRFGQLLQALAPSPRVPPVPGPTRPPAARRPRQPLRFLRIRGLPHGVMGQQLATLLGQAAHQIQTASMMPHARLQPSAPMSIVRTSSRPASATLSEPGEREHHDQPEQHLGHPLHAVPGRAWSD